MTTEPTLIVLCGMPGAGKSTWAAAQHDPVVSCDDVRAGANPAAVFERAHEQARALLARGGSVVFDACSLLPQARGRLLGLGRAAGARCLLVFFCTPMTLCATRNATRSQPALVDWIRVRAQARTAFRAVTTEPWDAVECVPTADPFM